jgi:hypothetical protein
MVVCIACWGLRCWQYYLSAVLCQFGQIIVLHVVPFVGCVFPALLACMVFSVWLMDEMMPPQRQCAGRCGWVVHYDCILSMHWGMLHHVHACLTDTAMGCADAQQQQQSACGTPCSAKA